MNLKSCHREEKQEYPGPLCLGLPQGRGESQRGPDWGPSVSSFSSVSQNFLGRNYKAEEVCVFGGHLEGQDITVFL